ncbi:Aldehyde dehydrogenase [Methanosarcina siciliae T4/M]|uniref:Aldehyde dehydrogenase n=2 Tax=Methanosarcina siciliae TaxID=38027 RepID=A0A0E3PGP9_9EURY|nr:aldehyde dehydrogenase family protein [Methanosarcina siciliae]AKB29270.1 Aldehyde dehydrogenase [Methanosarcina siciliae T4/M]AKB33197.1 Aldehyde dehydrogenase [Methanosarcina siciliae HI350]
MVQEYKLHIGGESKDSATGETFDDINPATLENLATIQVAGSVDVDRAVEAAEEGFRAWGEVPVPRRAEVLFRAARILQERKEDLARFMTEEMGKVLPETRGDVQEAIDIAIYAAGEGRRMFGETTTSELKDKFCMTVLRPIGVVGMITPWNFPMAIPGWKIMPALIAGNSIVFKPASDTPLLAIKLVEILLEAGLPPGVVNIVTGPGGSTGKAIVQHPRIKAISFTGSLETGKWIMEECAKTMKRVSLELGGKNPVIIMDDADLELALEGVLWGAFGTTGQRCTATSRLILHEKIKDEFTARLLAKTKLLRIGNGLLPETDIGPVINKAQLEKIERYVRIGIEEGATLLLGGKTIDSGLPGYFFEPTVFTDVKPDMKIAQEEIFGPVLSIITVSGLEEAIEVANNTRYGLSSAIYTESVGKAFRAVNKIEAGITYVNAPTIGAEVHLPFGGVKGTGNGFREAGTEAVKEFTEVKAVYIDYSGRLQRAQIDTE